MEIHDYQSGAMCRPKISLPEVKCQKDEHLRAYMYQPRESLKFAVVQATTQPGNTRLPHLWNPGWDHLQKGSLTLPVQELQVFHSELQETGKTIIT